MMAKKECLYPDCLRLVCTKEYDLHLSYCRFMKRTPAKMCRCPYNSRHAIPEEEIDHHRENCSDRESAQQFQRMIGFGKSSGEGGILLTLKDAEKLTSSTTRAAVAEKMAECQIFLPRHRQVVDLTRSDLFLSIQPFSKEVKINDLSVTMQTTNAVEQQSGAPSNPPYPFGDELPSTSSNHINDKTINDLFITMQTTNAK